MEDKVKVEADMEEIIQVATQLASQDSKTPPRVSMASSEEDNMDYDSDDDDDSKSNNSSSNQNNRKKRLKGEVKRSHHNVLERKRRDLIKDSFTKLKEAVPTLTAERASRAQILKKAADFIQLINQRNETTRADIDELVKKNSELESKIGNVKVKKEVAENGGGEVSIPASNNVEPHLDNNKQ